jgi:hypothetical protein
MEAVVRALASHMGKARTAEADACAKSNLYLECDVKAAQGSLISHRISSRRHALAAAPSKIASPKINLQLLSALSAGRACEREQLMGAQISLSTYFKFF